jgi:hypothetical protein
MQFDGARGQHRRLDGGTCQVVPEGEGLAGADQDAGVARSFRRRHVRVREHDGVRHLE